MLTPGELTVGQVGSDDVTVTLQAGQGSSVILRPATAALDLAAQNQKRRIVLAGWSSWKVLANDLDRVQLQLGNVAILEWYAVGVFRIRALVPTTLAFAENIDTVSINVEPFQQQLASDNWWFFVPRAWKSATNGIPLVAGDVATVFYSVNGNEARRVKWTTFDDADLRVGGTNIEKFMRALRLGYWAESERNLKDLRKQALPVTMTGPNLTRWGKPYLARRSGESDATYLVRLKGAIRRRLGGAGVDDILDFVAAILQTPTSSTTLRENDDGTTFRSAYFEVKFDLSLLASLGYSAADYTAIIAEINSALTQVAAEGVKGIVQPTGGSVYDTGTFDSGVYGG